jgi:hypothetical protein
MTRRVTESSVSPSSAVPAGQARTRAATVSGRSACFSTKTPFPDGQNAPAACAQEPDVTFAPLVVSLIEG